MIWKIPLADLNYDLNEENAVISVLRSKWLTMGEVTSRFEHDFSHPHLLPPLPHRLQRHRSPPPRLRCPRHRPGR